jgi:hypothetical protein
MNLHYDTWSWPLRTALSCAIGSLIYLMPVTQESPVIAAKILGIAGAAICSAMLLGVTVRTCWFCTRGAILGGALGTAFMNILLVFGWTSHIVIYIFLGLFSICILYYPMPALQQKITWALVTVALASLLQQGEDIDRL